MDRLSAVPISNIIELRHLRSFKAIVSVMHFTNAAELLHVGQPALSRTIKQLEEEIGFPLFDRDHKRIRLTNAGRVLAAQADKVLDCFDSAIAFTQQAARGNVGCLALAFTTDAIAGPLSDLLLCFKRDHSSIEISYHDYPLEESLHLVEAGKLDIVFYNSNSRAMRYGRGSKLFEPEQVYATLPAQHALAGERELHPEMLQGDVLIMPVNSTTSIELAQHQLDCADVGYRPQTLTVENMFTALSLVAAGVGITFLNDSSRVAKDGITYVPLTPEYKAQLNGYWSPQNSNPILSLFLTYIERYEIKGRSGNRVLYLTRASADSSMISTDEPELAVYSQ
jgi:DNA-binding transcriptional LysR family regulator